MKKDEVPHNFFVDLDVNKEVKDFILGLRETISNDLSSFHHKKIDVEACLKEYFPTLSVSVCDRLSKYFYLALKDAFDHGGISACNVILRHFSKEGGEK